MDGQFDRRSRCSKFSCIIFLNLYKAYADLYGEPPITINGLYGDGVVLEEKSTLMRWIIHLKLTGVRNDIGNRFFSRR